MKLLSVNLAMAITAERLQVAGVVHSAAVARRDNVMHFKPADAPAARATPAVAILDFLPQPLPADAMIGAAVRCAHSAAYHGPPALHGDGGP